MEPFYFGAGGRLFGSFHMSVGAPRSQGILIAGPLLNEGIRAHFALRQIAIRCATSGYDVLRFDYAGMGNSPGRTEDYSVDDWSRDIVDAENELVQVSGSRVSTVIAVRFGASLISTLTQSQELDRIVLWDPLLSGSQWLDRLREAKDNLPRRLRDRAINDDSEFQGHPVNAGFVDDLLALPPTKLRAESISIVVSSAYPVSDDQRSLAVEIDTIDPGCHWEAPTSELLYSYEAMDAVCRNLE